MGRSRAETMIQPVILEKLEELPESLQTEVLHYIEFLIEKQAKNSTQEKPTKKRRVAGTMKGMFVLPLPDDFDEPLEDMKEYMVNRYAQEAPQTEKAAKRGGLGIWKDKISMSDDFDEPLEDLKDYI